MHILFAVFCGSVALSVLQDISGAHIGAYQYLIGLGACATCNVYWLLARSLFRESNPFALPHLIFAVLLAAMIMAKQGYLFIDSYWQASTLQNQPIAGLINEVIVMMSSCVLVLAAWEGIRSFSKAGSTGQKQRLSFLCLFISAVAICKTADVLFADNREYLQLVVSLATIVVLIVTQMLIVWISNCRMKCALDATCQTPDNAAKSDKTDVGFASQIDELIVGEKRYLQTNLKIADIARELNVSEYKVSRVFARCFEAKNFNQYINEKRVEHAKKLLADSENSKWPVLVVGMESGFASVGPFTRAFKQYTGVTPNQYRLGVRQQCGETSEAC